MCRSSLRVQKFHSDECELRYRGHQARSVHTRLALAGHANALSIVDACRDIDFEHFRGARITRAAAFGTRLFDDLPRAMAIRQVCCTWKMPFDMRTAPAPPQVGQVFLEVPGLHPVPWQVLHSSHAAHEFPFCGRAQRLRAKFPKKSSRHRRECLARGAGCRGIAHRRKDRKICRRKLL